MSAQVAQMFFAEVVRPAFVPGSSCVDEHLDIRDGLYMATLLMHRGGLTDAHMVLSAVADACWLARLNDLEGKIRSHNAHIRRMVDGNQP